MKAFATLLDRLSYEPQRNEKLALIHDYLRRTGDPARGFALAALTGTLDFPHAKPALLRALIEARTDPVLFAWSYDYVGDLAETISLIWPSPERAAEKWEPAFRHGARQTKEPQRGRNAPPPALDEVVIELQDAAKDEIPQRIAALLDALSPTERWALLKMMTGALRVGVSARLAKTAVAMLGDHAVEEIEEVWHGLSPPYTDLLLWAEGKGPPPSIAHTLPFRPVMLSHALEAREHPDITPADFSAEWKWDGIRIQAARQKGDARLFSRTGEDIASAFPDLLDALDFSGVIDGELLVIVDSEIRPFAELQQRLNRKTVTRTHLQKFPAGLMAYDLLFEGDEDLRALPFAARRTRLEALVKAARNPRLALSPLVPFADFETLAEARANPPHEAIEGVMLKRKTSPYLAGRVRGHWYKWKRDPYLIDAVLMYAQRGHGKRSSFFSDYTFGVWRGDELVPVGKAYFGFTDEELAEIDRFVRNNAINRFGPVVEVEHSAKTGLVFEVAFEGLQRSPRHKSGLAMRFPRISRLRWDKPPAEADRIETLEALLTSPALEGQG